MKWFWTIVALSLVLGVVIFDRVRRGGASNPTSVDKSADAQATRDRILNDSISAGLIQRVEVRDTAADVWTGPLWNNSEFDAKQGAVNTVHARYLTDTYHGVNIIDGRTGKRIGRFVPALGGLRLD